MCIQIKQSKKTQPKAKSIFRSLDWEKMKIKSTFAAGKLETSEYSKIERVGLKGMKVKGLNKYISK